MSNKTPEGLRLFVDMVSMGPVTRKVIDDYTYTWEAEIKAHEETRRAFQRYATHRLGCEIRGTGKCDCGLDKAFAALGET